MCDKQMYQDTSFPARHHNLGRGIVFQLNIYRIRAMGMELKRERDLLR